MISQQIFLSGRAWNNGNIFSIPTHRRIRSIAAVIVSRASLLPSPLPYVVFAAFPPPRSPTHLSEHHEFSDLEGVRVTIGVKLDGKADREWLGRTGTYPCVPVAW